jgi:tRNA (guanine-N7-)-methyltransferase
VTVEVETPRAPTLHMRKVRSFVRRPGRATAAQLRALTELLPRYGISAATKPARSRRHLRPRTRAGSSDIGFGDGEALVTNALNNPTVDYFGIEVHEPGIGHLLLLLEKAAAANVRVHRSRRRGGRAAA